MPTNPPPPAETQSGGCLPAFLRLAWIFGPVPLLYFALFIVQGKGGALPDLAMLALTAAIILVRYIDIRFFKGETRDNRPATMAHWRRFAVMISAGAVILYALARFLAPKNLM